MSLDDVNGLLGWYQTAIELVEINTGSVQRGGVVSVLDAETDKEKRRRFSLSVWL